MRQFVSTALMALVSIASAHAGAFGDCAQDADANLKLTGCTKLIATNPGLAAAYSSRGDAFADLGQTDRAIADYSRAVALDGKLAAAFYNRALAYLAEGRAREAEGDFGKAIGIDGNDAVAYNGRAMARVALGLLDAADEDFSKAILVDPTYARAYLGRATLNLGRQRLAAAGADFDAVLRLHHGDADALRGRQMVDAKGAGADVMTTGSMTAMAPVSPEPPTVTLPTASEHRAKVSKNRRMSTPIGTDPPIIGGEDLRIRLSR